MCTVFEAVHQYTGRRVALKLLNRDYSDHPEARERLLREGFALGQVTHPYVIQVLDAGLATGEVPFVSTEFLEGRSLEGLITARGRLSLEDSVRVCAEVSAGLAACHQRGVLHRDVKPGNVMVVPSPFGDEAVKVLDFGVAKAPARTMTDPKLTRLDSLLGTPEYMAPEQLMGEEDLDARADLYALGVLLYECLTGRVPFEGSYQQVLVQQATTALKPVRDVRPEVPPAVDAVVARLLERRREGRYRDAVELFEALLATGLAGSPTRLLVNTEPEGAPRRRYRRAPYVTPVRIVSAARVVDARSEDISEGGLLVLSPEPFAEGETVQLRLALPTTGEMTQVQALVRWVRPRPGVARGCALGLEFTSAPQPMREAMSEYLAIMGRNTSLRP
jgi:serine/threonine protein kinase